MINDDDRIALFNSPTRVLKAEQILRKAGISCRLIPAPRDVAEGCALALRFAAAQQATIVAELIRQGVPPRRMYQKQGEAFLMVPIKEES
jgi:hypothetical protein